MKQTIRTCPCASEGSSEALNSPKADAINKQITDLGLEFRLMTQFTSFVAVEERIVNQNGQPVRVEVPVAGPEGVDLDMAGGRKAQDAVSSRSFSNLSTGAQMSNIPASVSGLTLSPGTAVGSGTGSGSGGGSGSGSGSGSAGAPPPSKAVSGGVINGQAISATSVVEVTAAAETKINTTDSSISTTIRPDSSGNFRIVSPSGGGGGGGGRREEKEERVDKPKPKSGEEQREWKLKQKAHQYIYRLMVSEGKEVRGGFVRDGKASIRLSLANPSAALMERLKAAGLEVVTVKGSTVTGRIDVGKLRALLEIEEVKLVLPDSEPVSN